MTHSMLAGADMIVDGQRLSGRALWIQDGRIRAVGPDRPGAAGRVVLPADTLLAPGLVDIQVNGGGGVQFNDTPTEAAALAMAAAHRHGGTTAILPTVITDTAEIMRRAAAAATAAAARIPHGGVFGVHFEGPFLSLERPGVHTRALIRPPDEADLVLLETLAANLPVLLTLAPEAVCDADLLRLSRAGVILCAGHGAASAERVQAAVQCGLRGFTHVFNAMPPPAARDPGMVGVALTTDATFCGVIADLIHVHPAMLRLLLRCKPLDRIMLVSDAMAVTATDMTEFMLQGRRILRGQGRLMTETGVLAGADLTLARAVRTMAGLPGVTLPQAIAMASSVPAAFMGLGQDIGAIAAGCRADLVLLSSGLDVLGTWLGGVFQKAPGA